MYLYSHGSTVWYSWTAPASGWLSVAANNLTGNPLIPRFCVGLFTGSQLANLKKIAGGQDGAAALVTGGQTYVIGVDGDQGEFRLALNFLPRPANDSFTNRLMLSGAIATVTNNNASATIESGEPIPAKGMANASLWYQWTAPAAGLVRVLAEGDGFVPAISVYQGTSLKKLARVANSLNMNLTVDVWCSFQAKAGSTYVISVDGLNAEGRGRIVLQVDLTTLTITSPLPNAIISAASPPLFSVNQPLAAVDGLIQAVDYLAVQVDGSYRSVGCSYQPPFTIVPTNLPAGVITLFAIATNADDDIRISAPLSVKVRPVNDDFAHSLRLEGYDWEASGTTAQATVEKSEPKHGKYGTKASVWWAWTAPASGKLQIIAQLGDTTSLRNRGVGLYTGTSVSKLTAVPCVTASTPGGLPYYNVVGGTTYHLAVGAPSPDVDAGIWPFSIHGQLTSVAFNAPTGQVYTEPVDLPVGITNSENPAAIQRVEFLASDGYTNDQLIASVTGVPFRFVWSNAPPGDYTLEARVVKWTAPNPLSAFRTVSVRPINDAFSNRIVLQTNFAWLTHRIAGCTREPGEPAHNGNAYAPSAWWSWTAPANGKLILSDPSGETSAGLALYAGTNLASLTPVTNQAYPPFAYHLETLVRGGTTYQIAATPGPTPDVNAQLRFYPPPPNDNFSNRLTLTGSSVDFEGYTISATREPDEPDHIWNGASHTIWWTWTAPDRGNVVLSLTTGTYVYYRVYTGDTLASLQPVSPPRSSAMPITFETLPNTAYQIVLVGDYDGEERDGGHLEFTPAATNDSFAARALLDGTNFTFIADNRGASVETGEPPLAGGSGRTLWWSWTAPADGMLYLRAPANSELPHGTMMLEVFQGDSLTNLNALPGGGGDQIYIHAVSNETYQIRFDANGPVPYGIPITLDFIPAPSNDNFADATVLSGMEISTNGTIRGASAETNDPAVWVGANDGTVWYAWTAPQDESVIVYLPERSDFSVLKVFTGSSLTNLTQPGTIRYSDAVLLGALAGTTYYFSIAEYRLWEPDYPDAGPFRLALTLGEAPANDNFADAQWLMGTNMMIVATNWVATLEPNDPPIVDWYSLQRTLWYQWQAPASGLLVLTNAGSTVQPIIATYLGTNLNQLWMIGGIETPVRSNETAHILVDGDYGAAGVIQLGLTFISAPANDDFEQAIPVFGTSLELTGYVRAATGQSTSPSDRNTYQYRDLWWLWTAPGSGHVVITNLLAGALPCARVYTGTALTNLQLVAWFSIGQNVLEFDAVAGTCYFVQGTWGVGGDNLDLGLAETLSLSPAVAGSNKAASVEQPTTPIRSMLRIASPLITPDGRFVLHLQGKYGARYQLEWSSDLVHWKPFSAGVLTNDSVEVIDPEAGAVATRFYRLRQ